MTIEQTNIALEFKRKRDREYMRNYREKKKEQIKQKNLERLYRLAISEGENVVI
jgi:hypothetical protein